MSEGQFRFAYFTPVYESTVEFYRDGLEFPLVESWDRGPEDRGTLFSAASGIIEVLTLPRTGIPEHLWDRRPPQGAFMVIELGSALEELYRRVVEKGLPLAQEMTNQSWGHRSFCVREPNGLTLYFFREIQEGR